MAWGYCKDCHRWSFELVKDTRRCPVCDEFQHHLARHWANQRLEKEIPPDPVDTVLALNLLHTVTGEVTPVTTCQVETQRIDAPSYMFDSGSSGGGGASQSFDSDSGSSGCDSCDSGGCDCGGGGD